MCNFKINKILNVICVVYRVIKALTEEHIYTNCTPVTTFHTIINLQKIAFDSLIMFYMKDYSKMKDLNIP